MDRKSVLTFLVIGLLKFNFAWATNPVSDNSYIDEALQGKELIRQQTHKNSDTDVFHLFSHGRPGELLIQGKWYSGEKLAHIIATILPRSTRHLNIYGCDFAQGKGQGQLEFLKAYLGISIGASTNRTGLNGDWVLEAGTSQNPLEIKHYPFNLQACAGTIGGLDDDDDFDGDGVCNSDDDDDDNDGIPDSDEYAPCNNTFTPTSRATSNNVRTGTETWTRTTGFWPFQQTETCTSGFGGTTHHALGIYSECDIRGTYSASWNATVRAGIPLTVRYTLRSVNNHWLPNGNSSASFRINGITVHSMTNDFTGGERIFTFTPGSTNVNLDLTLTFTRTNFNCDAQNLPEIGLNFRFDQQGEISYNNCPMPDSDNDGIPDKFDLDSDSDGCPDALEGDGGITQADITDFGMIAGNVDANGVPNGGTTQGAGSALDASVQSSECDACDAGSSSFVDTDVDGVANECDLDDDNDGILDVNELQDHLRSFQQGDTTPSYIAYQFPGMDVDFVREPALTDWFLDTTTDLSVNGSINATTPASQLELRNITDTSFLEAKGNGNYIEQTFSTGDNLVEPYLDRVHIEWETSDEADNYALTTEVYEGTDLIYQSPTKQISPTTSDDASSATRLFYFLIPYGQRVALKSGTTYTVRIYPHSYDAASSTEDFGAFDDLTLRFSGALGLDTDTDGSLDYQDLDSDDDGCPDALEGESSTFVYSDLNSDGSIDTTAFPVDGDGKPGSTDNAIGTSRNNGLQAAECDSCDAASTLFSDNDEDGIGDDCDLDDDNDGILDDDEILCDGFMALDLVTLETADEIVQEPIRNVAGSSTFDFEPSANHTATSVDFPKGRTNGDIRFSTEDNTEVSEYELTFEFPVDIKISQASRGGAFEFRETYSIRAEGINPSLIVADPGVTDVPSVTGGVTTQYSGNELANITGNGTDFVHFSPATDNASGNIAPEDSQWSVTATQITKLILRVINTSPSQNISKLRIATNCSKLDTDDDGIPNHFDNDSDNDGCPDALEGDGDYTFDDIDEFGKITIGNVNTDGIPNNGSSQGEGSSKDAATQDEECNDACHPNSTLFQDDDGDGVGNACDQDQDNDGILDVDEGFCDATATYSLDIQASFDTNTLGNNGGTMNLVFKLTDGSPLPQIGDEFTVPIFVSDFNNTATNVVHNWDALYIDDGEFNMVPDEQTFYTDLPPNNQAEIFFGEPGTDLSGGDAKYRFWIDSGMLDILGNYKVNIGSLPSSFFLQGTTLSATNQWNLASGGNSYKSGYYSRSTVEGTFRPYNFTFGNNGNYQTYQFEYTAFGNGGATDSNGRRGLVAFSFGEVVYCNPRDSDGDGIPDYLDTDSDNDGCPDALEATSSTFTLADLNPDGSINTTVHPVDTDENSATYGAPDGISNGAGSVQDSSLQGTECDSCNPASSLFMDTDNDGIGDDCDLDDDNDGIWDTEECEAINIENYGTFGWDATGTARDLQNPPGGNYAFVDSNSSAGEYAVISRNTANWHVSGYWEDLAGADTGHDNDAYLAVNGAVTSEVVISEDINLSQGVAQTIQIQVANAAPTAGVHPIEIGMRLMDASGTIVAFTSTGSIADSHVWHTVSLPITPTGTDYTLEIYNISLGSGGNDFAIDAIRFSHGMQCQDLDGDGLVESLDLDSDGDSCPDALESRDNSYGIPDLNADGSINITLHPIDNAPGGVTYGVPGGVSFGMGTSQDDTSFADTCNYIEVTIEGNNDISVIEGEDAVLTIQLSEGFPEDITLDITFTNISASDADYTVTTTVTIPANSTSVDLVIPILDDTIIEPTESFQISISSTHLALDIVEGEATVNIIDNDAAIQPNENYEEDVEIICGEMLPPVPQLTFSGGCHEYDVDFDEQRSDIEGSHDYWVIRTWTVTDICDTVEIFEQRIYVAQPDPITVEMESCIYDAPVDLLSHLPEGIPDSGTFELLNGDGTLDGSMYDSQNAQTGLHQVYYEVPHQNCITSVIFDVDVNGDCRDDACNFDRMIMPKTITVNGDGINDYFEIKGLEACGYTFQLKVFNRWGTIIYQNDAYDNTWDGTAPENSMGTATHIPSGTYYYIITVPELNYEGRTGYIYIGGQ